MSSDPDDAIRQALTLKSHVSKYYVFSWQGCVRTLRILRVYVSGSNSPVHQSWHVATARPKSWPKSSGLCRISGAMQRCVYQVAYQSRKRATCWNIGRMPARQSDGMMDVVFDSGEKRLGEWIINCQRWRQSLFQHCCLPEVQATVQHTGCCQSHIHYNFYQMKKTSFHKVVRWHYWGVVDKFIVI